MLHNYYSLDISTWLCDFTSRHRFSHDYSVCPQIRPSICLVCIVSLCCLTVLPGPCLFVVCMCVARLSLCITCVVCRLTVCVVCVSSVYLSVCLLLCSSLRLSVCLSVCPYVLFCCVLCSTI